MPRLTRDELYGLVWSEPMQALGPRFGLSDVGLRKVCLGLDVPVPERGYWNKLQAGKTVVRAKLPARGPGMPDWVVIGTAPAERWNVDPEAVLQEVPPEEPVFPEPIAALKERLARGIGKVPMIRHLDTPHPAIRKLLESDERRRQKQRASPSLSGWYAPYFDSPFEQRRLRLLNSLFLGLAGAGAKPWARGPVARELGVQVGAGGVTLHLDHPDAKRNRQGLWSTRAGEADILELRANGDSVWRDSPGLKLDAQLKEIVVALLVQGELAFRSAAQGTYRWGLRRREEAERQLVARREEADARARAERLRLEQEARQALLAHARASREAADIRTLVEGVRQTAAARALDEEPVEAWCAWALDVAAGLDPLERLKLVDGRLQLERPK